MLKYSAGKFPACPTFVPHKMHRNLYNKSYIYNKSTFLLLNFGRASFCTFINLFNLLLLKNANFMLVSLQIDEDFSDERINI